MESLTLSPVHTSRLADTRCVKTLRIVGWCWPSRYLLATSSGYTTWLPHGLVRELGGLGLATTDLVNPAPCCVKP